MSVHEVPTLVELAAGAVIGDDSVLFPGAVAPQRDWRVDADGVGIAVHEWGDPTGRPLFLVHGGLDFARTYDVFAPLLARHGWRVISWDHRSHGDSDHAAFTGWAADLRDAVAVLDAIGFAPAPIVGHSKGGAMALRLAEAMPHRFAAVVNLDGIPSKWRSPDISDTERSRMLASEMMSWLDHRNRSSRAIRKPDTLEGLARRRAKMNPRLAHEWLCYLVTVGGRHDADGWRWKIDPLLRPGGFGPWRPEWSLDSVSTLAMPFLGVLCEVNEPMGWGTDEADVRPRLGRHGELITVDTGHFIHIEQPARTAATIIDFFAANGVRP
jgi:pimeloyl-ACP methyl ester carboxylesterase